MLPEMSDDLIQSIENYYENLAFQECLDEDKTTKILIKIREELYKTK
jgi:hypothetical protein